MEARARGTRKIESKLAGNIEQFIETDLLLAAGRRWDILAGSRAINNRPILRSDMNLLSSASVCVEAVKHISKPLSKDKRIFLLLRDAMDILERKDLPKEHTRAVAGTFLWKLLHTSGFAPELENCINCRIKSQKVMFSAEGGGILCDSCQNRDIFAINIDNKELNELRESRIISQKSFDLVIQYWNRIVDHAELKSLEFFNVINQNTFPLLYSGGG
jgi:DNA repair protein RecO (recombination protein O)